MAVIEDQWVTLAMGTIIAGVSQLLKIVMLADSQKNTPRAARAFAMAIAGALGYFSYVMILAAFVPERLSRELMLGTASPIGWIGGDVNLAIGRFLQHKLGVPLGIPDLPSAPKDEE